jgi:Tfp pilus assembly protein PilO
MKANSRVLVSLVVVLVAAGAFWKMAVSPKREEAGKLDQQVEKLQAAVEEQRAAAALAAEAKKTFPEDYHQLILLGKAVPAGDDTSSLLVELNRIARKTKVDFRDLELEASALTAAPTPVAAAPASGAPSVTDVPSSTNAAPVATVPATEAAASVLPLGASLGTAGLGVMPYKLSFAGSFFDIANFMAGVDNLVKTKTDQVGVDGRLITIDGFALTPNGRSGYPLLEMSMTVTTYLTPPTQGVTAGATPTAPAPATATPTATTTP